MVNSAALLTWNTRKTYLAELAAAKVPVIPTVFVDRGLITPQMLVDAAAQFGGVSELVVKPQVSASSDGTVRINVNSHPYQAWKQHRP